MELTSNEERLLKILFHLKNKDVEVSLEKLEEIKNKHIKEDFEWQPTINSLSEKIFIKIEKGIYTLTKEGYSKILNIIKNKKRKGSNKALIAFDKSEVYKIFCEKVYGKYLCQMNMATMKQIDCLIELLKLNNDNNILDIGCGVGKISEYISDLTKAKITGIDIADQVILKAQTRTKNKINRINYIAEDFDELGFEDESFDRIIAIDTVYFSKNLFELVQRLKKILTQNGMMGIFYSQRINDNKYKKMLNKNHTKFANILNDIGLKYNAYDFTEDEKNLWKDQLKVVNEMKKDFLRANELEIYNARIRESSELIKYVEDNKISRHLYIIEKN